MKDISLISILMILLFICIAWPGYSQNNSYSNPVGDSLFIADPAVLLYNGKYYLYGTSAGDGFKGWISDDLANWDSIGYVFRRNENTWGTGSFWAPEVIHYRNRFNDYQEYLPMII